MTWNDVRAIASETAAELPWGGADDGRGEPLMLERLARKLLREPRRTPTKVTSRLVMVVPTKGVEGARDGSPDVSSGWAVRLRPDGRLEYLRFRATGTPRWDAGFPFDEHELEPFTPGADHWSPLDREQLTKTDLDWSVGNRVSVEQADGSRAWTISPGRRNGSTGAGLAAALSALRSAQPAQ